MAAKRYIVHMTDEERAELLSLINKGKTSARVLARARILLKADEGWKDKDIVEALNTSVLIALACSKAPEGHTVWSMRLLAGTLVEF